MADSSKVKDEYFNLARLSVDAFVRSVAVNRGRPVCFLLGAGASISSGMPSAQRCIWEWKQDIFVTNNPTLRESVGELSLPGTRNRIQSWLDQRGLYPEAESQNEYSFYAGECYPTGQDRRSFFQSYVVQAKPHTGYRLLALLAKHGLVRTAWTTNFDGLIARACAIENVVAVEVGADSQHRTLRQHASGELRTVSLHGDYRYDDLKNTDAELQEQEQVLRDAFLSELQGYDLVVVGYSGRDASIMATLQTAFLTKNNSRLFWCGYGDEISSSVNELLHNASISGRDAFYVPTEGFDDLMVRLALRQLEGQSLAEAKKVLEESSTPVAKNMAFSVPPIPATTLVKSNAYPLTCPIQAVKLDLAFPENLRKKAWLNECLSTSAGFIVSMQSGALALADTHSLQEAFGNYLRVPPVTVALSDKDIATDGRIQSLLRRALIHAAAAHLEVETDGKLRIWEKTSYQSKFLQGINYGIHRALSFKLSAIDGKPHVILMPEVVATSPDGELADRDSSKVLRNAIYGYQHNDKFNEDLDHWVKKITKVELLTSGGGKFVISRMPVYAGLAQKGNKPLPDDLQRFAKQSGLVIADANLMFSSLNGSKEIRSPSPLKGLVENRPWDFQLTCSGLSPKVEMAVICPSIDSPKLKRFLGQFQERSVAEKSERDYLHDFPGFTAAFGLPLTYPNQGDSCWVEPEEPSGYDTLASAKQLAQRICSGLDIIRSLRPGAVATIFIPTRWSPFKAITTETEQFNLHDYVKAYAARHGQSTQFLREETTNSKQECRVRWWLSLAIYAKALRTPWRLDCLDDETAFVGIGYSMDVMADRGSQVLLGCSHLYSARGEGLQFRLGRIENPVIRGRNPFMSEDDARRTGETIRQLFYDAKMRLPKRVVVHKRTHFTEEEQRGLVQGLDGVENIELIEVNMEESMRYLASKLAYDKLTIDKFPIARGTVIVQNASTALLWVHGTAPNAQNPQLKYYQGKRRIPAPLLIRRYMGQSDVVQVATEILGLSKMNWNTFDYYSRLPATLDSASAIAKVGAYLSGFGAAPYDYRLLI